MFFNTEKYICYRFYFKNKIEKSNKKVMCVQRSLEDPEYKSDWFKLYKKSVAQLIYVIKSTI